MQHNDLEKFFQEWKEADGTLETPPLPKRNPIRLWLPLGAAAAVVAVLLWFGTRPEKVSPNEMEPIMAFESFDSPTQSLIE